MRANARIGRARARGHALRERLPAIVSLLVGRYGARRVVLFGSLARGDQDVGADVDLAVEGVAKEAYFAALGELLLVAGAEVDLVRLEEGPEWLRAAVEAEGQVLYES